LRDAINGLPPNFELRFQFFACQRFYVGQHASNVNGAGRKTKQALVVMLIFIKDISAGRIGCRLPREGKPDSAHL
jgi:hypothetical protein